MRLVVQRVLESSVKVDGKEVGHIGKGFMVLCGVEDGDTAEDVRYCVDKTVNLRVFEDAITFKIALMVVKYMKYMENQEY